MIDANQEELWLPIEDFEGFYEISSMGRVRGVDRYNSASNGSRFVKGKLLAVHNTGNGYSQAHLSKYGVYYVPLVHRLVAKAFIPNPENLEFVNHIDGVKHNNVVANLEWVTASQNQRHAVKLGLIRSGDNHPDCKIPFADVQKMRALASLGVSRHDLARVWSVSSSVVYQILRDIHRKTA